MKQVILKISLLSFLLTFITIGVQAQWAHDYYVDQFGDATELDYIGTIVNGKYSNTETSSAELAASIRISNRNGLSKVSFHLLKNKQAPTSKISEIEVAIKNTAGEVMVFDGSSGVLVNKDAEDFIEFLKQENIEMKFSVVANVGDDETKYIFTAGMVNFLEEYEKLSTSMTDSDEPIKLCGMSLGNSKTKNKSKTSFARIAGHLYQYTGEYDKINSLKFIPLKVMLAPGQQDAVEEYINDQYGIVLELTETESGAVASYVAFSRGVKFMFSKTRSSFYFEIREDK